MRPDTPLEPEVEKILEGHRFGQRMVALGSDVAVSPDAPPVTGQPEMDTQLENLRRMLCARVKGIHQLVIRTQFLRLWAVKRKEGDHAFPPSLIKRDDHPLVAVMVRQAQELAKISEIDCGGDPKLELLQVQVRLKALSDIQENATKIEKLGADALRQGQDLIKAFHAMAQQYRMHKERLDGAATSASDRELERIVASAPRADAMVSKLEDFLSVPKHA